MHADNACADMLGLSQPEHGQDIIKYAWNNRAKLSTIKASVDTLLGLPETQKLISLYPNLSKEFLSREFMLILKAARMFARDPMGPKDLEWPKVTDNSIVYVDPISKVPSLSISYGYVTDFQILSLHERKRLNLQTTHKDVYKMIGIKPICGIFSYAQLPKHYSFVLGVTGTLKCMTSDQVRIMYAPKCLTNNN
jgi:hypothetical protein